jgi:hypothetical protein
MFDDRMTSETGGLACTISRAGSTSPVMKVVLSRLGLKCGECWWGRHIAAAGTGVVAIVDAVVVVVRIVCVKDRSWRGSRSVVEKWTKTAGGARCVRGDESRECSIVREGGESGCAERSHRRPHHRHSARGRGRGCLCGVCQWGRR